MNINVNDLKTKVMDSFKYCKRVYDGGIETSEQFDSYIQLCTAHINTCNFWCNKVKPFLGIIQYNRYKRYKELYDLSEYTVSVLNALIAEINSVFTKYAEMEELREQIEYKMRIEHDVVMALKEVDIQEQHESGPKIGFINDADDEYYEEE